MIIKCCELQIINFNHKLKLRAYTKEKHKKEEKWKTTSQIIIEEEEKVKHSASEEREGAKQATSEANIAPFIYECEFCCHRRSG